MHSGGFRVPTLCTLSFILCTQKHTHSAAVGLKGSTTSAGSEPPVDAFPSTNVVYLNDLPSFGVTQQQRDENHVLTHISASDIL